MLKYFRLTINATTQSRTPTVYLFPVLYLLLFVRHEYLEEHPEGEEPPFPCNAWCKRFTCDGPEKPVVEKIVPFRNDTAGKKFGCKDVTPEDVFNDVTFMTTIRYEPVIGEDGEPIKKDDGTYEEWEYVYGAPSISFLCEQLFETKNLMYRIHHNLVVSNNGTMEGMKAIATNIQILANMISGNGPKASVTPIAGQT